MHLPRRLQSLFGITLLSLVAAGPATGPANASPPKTGELTLSFTERSPLSSRKEIARRLGDQESHLGEDYDVKTFTFRVYVPRDYDPATPYGLFVYLGNHDVPSVPPKWEPVFDKSHMIYIAPDWHSPQRLWQLIGLGFDAIENLKRTYNIDTHRLYDMWYGTGPLPLPIESADVYQGMIVCEDYHYWRGIKLSHNEYFANDIAPPSADFLSKARLHGVVVIGTTDHSVESEKLGAALKQDGFPHVLSISRPFEELHYPNYAAGWIADPVLPFLDKFAKQSAVAARPAATPATPATRSSGGSASSPAPPAAPATSPGAQHLLTMARLFIANGQPERARTNLQEILTGYPKDPAAATAKKLLESLPPPPPPQ